MPAGLCIAFSKGSDMDEEDRKKQAAVLADIELHKDASIEAITSGG